MSLGGEALFCKVCLLYILYFSILSKFNNKGSNTHAADHAPACILTFKSFKFTSISRYLLASSLGLSLQPLHLQPQPQPQPQRPALASASASAFSLSLQPPA